MSSAIPLLKAGAIMKEDADFVFKTKRKLIKNNEKENGSEQIKQNLVIILFRCIMSFFHFCACHLAYGI